LQIIVLSIKIKHQEVLNEYESQAGNNFKILHHSITINLLQFFPSQKKSLLAKVRSEGNNREEKKK